MTWGLVAVAGATLISGAMSSHAAGSAASAAQSAEQRKIDEQRRQYDQSRQDQSPYMDYGQSQLGGLSALARGDYSGFQNSPDYKYAQQQMIYGQDHSAAARGRLNSGGYAMDLAQGLNGLASQNLGNYRSSLQWGANLGQNAASGVGQLGANAANQIGSAYGNMGQAAANGAIGQSNAWGSTINGLGQLAGSYFGGRSTGGSGGGFGVPAQGSGTMAGFGATPNYASGGAGTFWGYP